MKAKSDSNISKELDFAKKGKVGINKMTIEEKSNRIKQRNEFIKQDKITVLDGGVFVFGDIYVIGEKHQEASKKMKEFIEVSCSLETLLKHIKEVENNFNVQVWYSTDFDISKIV